MEGQQVQGTGKGQGRRAVIGIVGLGDTGRALGLALQAVKKTYEIWGHDREPERVKEARTAGVIDRGHWNLVALAEGADVLFLTEPMTELCQTLELVAPHVRPGSLITDTAPCKGPVLAAAARCLPEGVSFIGGHPILRRTAGDEAGRLQGASYCLVPLPGAGETAMRVLGNLVKAMGAQPFYIDAQEHDALVAGVSQLPFVLDAVLARVLGMSPSAGDLRRLAGPAMGQLLRLSDGEAREAAQALAEDPAAVAGWLDRLLAELQAVRQAVAAAEPERLQELLAGAEEARQRWLEADTPDGAKVYEQLEVNPLREVFLGRLGRRRRE